MTTHPDMNPLFLGIDGGGTNCRARLCDGAGNVLGTGQGGSANCTPGLDQAFEAVMIATHGAFDAAGLSLDNLQRTFAGLGLAGLKLADKSDLSNRTFAHPFAGIVAELDAVVACLGAHMGQDGAILIVGTGTCGWLMKDGHSDQVGGWGFNMADKGGAAQLGRSALRRALKEKDGILPASPLGTSLMEQFDNIPAKMVAWSKSATPKDYGQFSPAVFDHAGQGDKVAISLISNAALEIDCMIAALVSKGADSVSLVGGMVEPMTPWLSKASLELILDAKGDPLDGAMMLARQAFEKRSVSDA